MLMKGTHDLRMTRKAAPLLGLVTLTALSLAASQPLHSQ